MCLSLYKDECTKKNQLILTTRSLEASDLNAMYDCIKTSFSSFLHFQPYMVPWFLNKFSNTDDEIISMNTTCTRCP